MEEGVGRREHGGQQSREGEKAYVGMGYIGVPELL